MNFKTAIFCILSLASSVILFAPDAENVLQPATSQSSWSYNPWLFTRSAFKAAFEKVYQGYQTVAGSKPIETDQSVDNVDMQSTKSESEELESVAQSSSMQSEKRSATILYDVLDQMSKNNFSSSSVVEVKHELPFRNEPVVREQYLGVYQLFADFFEGFKKSLSPQKHTPETALKTCKEKLEAFVNESSNLGLFTLEELKSEILGHLEQIFANAYDDKTLLLYLKNSLDKKESKVLLTIKKNNDSLKGLRLEGNTSLQQVIDAAGKFKSNFEIKFFIDYLTLLKDCQDIKVDSTPEAVVAVQKYLELERLKEMPKKELVANYLREQELPEADDEPAVPVQVFNPPVKSNQANNKAKGFSPQTSWSNMPHRLSEQDPFEAMQSWSAMTTAPNRSANNFGRGQGAFKSVKPLATSPSRSANNFTIQEVSQKPELKSISTQTGSDSARSLRLNKKLKKFRKKRGVDRVRFTPRLENEENLKNEHPFYGDQTTANQRINNLSRSLNNIRTLSSDGI